MSALKRTDIVLLKAALASNGGGTAEWRHKSATIQRLIKAGLVQWKPNHTTMITITPAGKVALAELGT